MLTAIAPQEPEVHGLLALMELNASRGRARTDADGNPVLLMDQNRALWDRLQISRGLRSLVRVHELGGGDGFYALQAEIVACHARASCSDDTNWHAIIRIYDALLAQVASPVIALNRAVAVGMANGPAAALKIVDELADEPTLKSYHLLPTVRGDLLFKLWRQLAAKLTGNMREREMMSRRAAAVDAALGRRS
jgi:predicted RNA polymerase sigma factor